MQILTSRFPFPVNQYIALEQLEVTYRTSSLVSNICVHATSQAKQPIAIIFPHAVNLKSAVRAAAAASSSSSSSSSSPSAPSFPDAESDVHLLCSSPAVHDLLLKDLQALAKKAGLKGIEIVQGVVLTPDEWTAESGLLTAAQKVQRKAVERAFNEEISVSLATSSRHPGILPSASSASRPVTDSTLLGVLQGKSRLEDLVLGGYEPVALAGIPL
jgi:long-subunit acyl-CoA synthetase (AMP-forming)